ncbi:hypothetical protein B296_00052669, partial [Ensete ventricosum]
MDVDIVLHRLGLLDERWRRQRRRLTSHPGRVDRRRRRRSRPPPTTPTGAIVLGVRRPARPSAGLVVIRSGRARRRRHRVGRAIRGERKTRSQRGRRKLGEDREWGVSVNNLILRFTFLGLVVTGRWKMVRLVVISKHGGAVSGGSDVEDLGIGSEASNEGGRYIPDRRGPSLPTDPA